jgi:hypothetical protein
MVAVCYGITAIALAGAALLRGIATPPFWLLWTAAAWAMQREAAVLLAQRIEVLSTKPWRDARAAQEMLSADVARWQQQAMEGSRRQRSTMQRRARRTDPMRRAICRPQNGRPRNRRAQNG